MKTSVTQCPTSTHPAKKYNSCMHCMPMILLFVAIVLRTVFFFTALLGGFVELNLVHGSFSPPIKYFVQIIHNAFLVSVRFPS